MMQHCRFEWDRSEMQIKILDGPYVFGCDNFTVHDFYLMVLFDC